MCSHTVSMADSPLLFLVNSNKWMKNLMKNQPQLLSRNAFKHALRGGYLWQHVSWTALPLTTCVLSIRGNQPGLWVPLPQGAVWNSVQPPKCLHSWPEVLCLNDISKHKCHEGRMWKCSHYHQYQCTVIPYHRAVFTAVLTAWSLRSVHENG